MRAPAGVVVTQLHSIGKVIPGRHAENRGCPGLFTEASPTCRSRLRQTNCALSPRRHNVLAYRRPRPKRRDVPLLPATLGRKRATDESIRTGSPAGTEKTDGIAAWCEAPASFQQALQRVVSANIVCRRGRPLKRGRIRCRRIDSRQRDNARSRLRRCRRRLAAPSRNGLFERR